MKQIFSMLDKPAIQLGSAIVIALLLTGVSTADFPAFSQVKYPLPALLRCSHDQSILKALDLLSGTQGQGSLDKIVQKPMRVIFKDMGTLHKSLKNYDALSWISANGEQVIFINEKHRSAPPEALAAMIAHEAMHADEFNSLNEEVTSWQHEARVWMEMKQRYPELGMLKPGTFALVDRENRIEAEYRQGTLEAFVRNSPGYQGLPETSPGFSSKTASTQ